MKKLLRSISIRQPWVELILRGDKKAEYRSKLTRIRERVYIYASRHYPKGGASAVAQEPKQQRGPKSIGCLRRLAGR